MQIWHRDDATFYSNAVEKYPFGNTGVPVLLCGPDPDRVCLIVSVSANASNPTMSTNPKCSIGQGIALGPSDTTRILTYAEHGPLVQQAWYGNGSAVTNTFTVITLALPRNPQDYGYSGVYATQRQARATPIVPYGSAVVQAGPGQSDVAAQLVAQLAQQMPDLWAGKGE